MKSPHAIGLGEPAPGGKLTLFQPAQDEKTNPRAQEQRIRTTIELTQESLIALQKVQQEYRLRTGHVLPLWKALSQVIEAYQKNRDKSGT